MLKVLVVVDYQNDFVTGALGFDNADKIEKRIIELIDEFKQNGYMIAFTKDTHGRDYLATVEGKKLPIEHCIRGTDGWKLRDKIEEKVEYFPVFEKKTFPSLELGNFLSGYNPKEVHLCGLVSDICVISNAIIAKAACPNAEIYVHKDACDSNDKDMQEKAYEMMKHLHINVI